MSRYKRCNDVHSEGELREREAQQWSAVEGVRDEDVRLLVLSYLVHQCQRESAKQLLLALGSEYAVQTDTYLAQIDARKRVLDALLVGKVRLALELMQSDFPAVLADVDVAFHLYIQLFIELVRERMTKEALQLAQTELALYARQDSRLLEPLQDAVALLAYSEPEESPIASYLQQDQRERTAHKVNSAILVAQGLPARAGIERLLRQLVAVRDEVRKPKDGGRWSLRDLINDVV